MSKLLAVIVYFAQLIPMGQCQIQKSQSKIDVLHIEARQLQSNTPAQTCLYKYPQRDLKIIEAQEVSVSPTSTNQFKFQKITIGDKHGRKIDFQYKKYDYLSSALLFQHSALQISEVLIDQLYCDRLIYLIKKYRENYSLIIRKFQKKESQQFLNSIYQINTYETIAKLQSPYLHKIIKHYNIESNNEFINHHSKVIVLEPLTANLSLIIKHRRSCKLVWSLAQFYVLMRNLVDAVATLHQVGLVHNDIRPSNVYYCFDKKVFLLGSFQNIIFASSLPESAIKKHNIYKDMKRKGSLPQITYNVQDENKKSDVYSLGMTLLSAFYLALFIDRKKSAPYNRFYASQYPFLEIIRLMTCRIQKRNNIFEIQQKMKKLQRQYKLQGIKTIQLEDYSLEAKKYIEVYKRQRFIADGYKMLSLIGNWKEGLKTRHIHKKISDNTVESAKYYEQLAVISYIQGKIQKSKNFYIHSAQIYYKIGLSNFRERDFQNAIIYFQEGIDNFKIIEQRSQELTYLKLLVSLFEVKIISGTELIESERLIELQKLIYKVKNIEPFAFWEYVQQLINIYKYYQNYDKIHELLQTCLEVSPHIQTKIGPITLDKMMIENNLKISQLKSRSITEKRSIITSTELTIHNILNDKEYYFISHPLEKLQLNLLSSKIKMLKGATKEAINILQDMANLFETNDNLDDQLQNNNEKNRYSTLKGQIYQALGDIWFSLEEMATSMKYFAKATQNYKQYYGDIYNIECATLIEKIAMINKKKKNHSAYTDSIQLVLKILKTEYGRNHKDIARISNDYKKQGVLSKNLGSTMRNRTISDSDMQSISQW